MADKLMYISNDNKQNCSFCKLVVEMFRLNEPTNQNTKTPKLLSQEKYKFFYKTVDTSIKIFFYDNYLCFFYKKKLVCYSFLFPTILFVF